ncbi:MAG: B12-binding domain-containing radical SAM protein [Deltaproteobacteria bacterium]|nr:B12-binding domain-containing radical SAM protein [Deltaproteobacteria bacterium]
MKIALINVSGQLSLDGSRLISALLKRGGHHVWSVFLARKVPLHYHDDELAPLHDLLRQVDLVLLAIYSTYAIRAVQITQFIHRHYPGLLVIWGGPHCISAPELGLQYADGVCFSEGDEAVLDFVDRLEAGADYLSTPNMAFKTNGSHIVNKSLPPFTDLDSLPYYDYGLEDHFLLDHGLFPITKKILKERHAGYPYYTPMLYFLTSRGCPHRCSYCNNSRYIQVFGHNTIRFHTVDRIIDELVHTLEHFDFFQLVGFGDDDFFARPTKQIEDFARQYKKKIGLPFGIAVSANTFKKEKMEVLLASGLRVIQMGVQSGSQRMLDQVYNRKISVQKTKEAVQAIQPFLKKTGLDLLLDFIVDSPYETKADIAQTYRYLLDLPLNVGINLFFLAFFPGTPIYERALRDGIIEPFNENTFRLYTRGPVRYQKNYEMVLVLFVKYLRQHPGMLRFVPRFMLRFLGSGFMCAVASMFPKSFYSLISKTFLRKKST